MLRRVGHSFTSLTVYVIYCHTHTCVFFVYVPKVNELITYRFVRYWKYSTNSVRDPRVGDFFLVYRYNTVRDPL